MSSYPIVIESQTLDLYSSFTQATTLEENEEKSEDHIYSNGDNLEMVKEMKSTIKENDLSSFKEYLDNKDEEIWNYIGENGVVYSYNTPFTAYAYDEDEKLVIWMEAIFFYRKKSKM